MSTSSYRIINQTKSSRYFFDDTSKQHSEKKNAKKKGAHRLILIKFSGYAEAISELKADNAALGDAAWVIGRPTTR